MSLDLIYISDSDDEVQPLDIQDRGGGGGGGGGDMQGQAPEGVLDDGARIDGDGHNLAQGGPAGDVEQQVPPAPGPSKKIVLGKIKTN